MLSNYHGASGHNAVNCISGCLHALNSTAWQHLLKYNQPAGNIYIYFFLLYAAYPRIPHDLSPYLSRKSVPSGPSWQSDTFLFPVLSWGIKAFINSPNLLKSPRLLQDLGKLQSCPNVLVVLSRYQMITQTYAHILGGVHWHSARGFIHLLYKVTATWTKWQLYGFENRIRSFKEVLATAFPSPPWKMKLISARAWGMCRYITSNVVILTVIFRTTHTDFYGALNGYINWSNQSAIHQ